MAGVVHGSARTTARVRVELQTSKEGTRALAARYGLNPKTVAKWRSRTSTSDAAMGSRDPRSTVLRSTEEVMIVEFRRRTPLPLDDVMGCLRDAIPTLSRSALHRCLQRHGISRLPASEDRASKGGHFVDIKIGFIHIDSCELPPGRGQARHVPRHRPSVQVYHPRLPRQCPQDGRCRVPPSRRGDLPVCDPHRAHR